MTTFMNGVIYFLQDAVDKTSVFSLSSFRVLREHLTAGSVPTSPLPLHRAEVIAAFSLWSGSCGQMIRRAIPAVA